MSVGTLPDEDGGARASADGEQPGNDLGDIRAAHSERGLHPRGNRARDLDADRVDLGAIFRRQRRGLPAQAVQLVSTDFLEPAVQSGPERIHTVGLRRKAGADRQTSAICWQTHDLRFGSGIAEMVRAGFPPFSA